jgi:hypothetical protein
MKKCFPLVLLIATALFLSSCDKDKDSKPNFTFTYDGDSYAISKGYIVHNWDEQGIFEKSIVFSSKGYIETYLQSSDYVVLQLRTDNSDLTIPDGTYAFNENWVNDSFYWGSVAIGFNAMDETGELNEDPTAGTVTVSNGGKKFVFAVEFADGKEVSGTFEGTLEPFED